MEIQTTENHSAPNSLSLNYGTSCFGDKGYIFKDLFSELFGKWVHLVTMLKRSMKYTALTPVIDAILLRKRAIEETIIDQLKNTGQVEHS